MVKMQVHGFKCTVATYNYKKNNFQSSLVSEDSMSASGLQFVLSLNHNDPLDRFSL